MHVGEEGEEEEEESRDDLARARGLLVISALS